MTKNSISFERLPAVDDMSGVIEDMFGVKLDISGGWGYDPKSVVIVNSLDKPIDQFLYTFSNIRANTEMNMILNKEDRYGSINTTFIEGKQIELENVKYDMITFQITAMKEDIYAEFIQEYKDNYAKNKNFDLDDHFKRRKESTITIKSDFWFCGLQRYYTEDSK